MKILFYYADEGGCGYYRMKQPAKFLSKIKGVDCMVSNITSQGEVEWADVIVWQRQWYTANLMTMKMIAKTWPDKLQVYEVDDLFEMLPVDNPAYTEYQQNNQQPLRNMNEMRHTVDTITVSTKTLMRRYEPTKPTYTLPNSLDFKQWKFDKQENKKIRIGWAGSKTHHRDLLQLGDALKQIEDEYKDKVEFYFYGYAPSEIYDPLTNKKAFDYSKLGSFIDNLRNYNFDIALAPLEQTSFNDAKSNIKYLEYSALKIPVIASDVGPYKETIVNNETGLLVKNRHSKWVSALRKLIEDKNKRKQLATNAYKFTRRFYDMEKNAIRWLEAYKKELDIKRTALLKKVDKQINEK